MYFAPSSVFLDCISVLGVATLCPRDVCLNLDRARKSVAVRKHLKFFFLKNFHSSCRRIDFMIRGLIILDSGGGNDPILVGQLLAAEDDLKQLRLALLLVPEVRQAQLVLRIFVHEAPISYCFDPSAEKWKLRALIWLQTFGFNAVIKPVQRVVPAPLLVYDVRAYVTLTLHVPVVVTAL